MEPEATVFIVDDDKAVLDSLAVLIETVGMNVQTYTNCRDFLNDYVDPRPGCLLLDIRMPGMSGLELLSKLSEQQIDIPVIIITGHGDVPMAVEAMKKGAIDFIEKPFRDQVLLDAVNKAVSRDAESRKQRTAKQRYFTKREVLTPREKQVMDLLVAGKTNKQVGFELGISIKTVDYHRQHLMDKMEADTIVELAHLVLNPE